MNKKEKAKLRKLKEENRKLRNENKNKIDITQMWRTVDYKEERRKNLIEDTLKLLVRRHYGRFEHTATKIEIDAREIEAMKQYKLDIEKNPYFQTLDVYVR